MPKSSKAGAIVVMIVGILVAAFFVVAVVKGGFSGSSLIGILLGVGVAIWQLKSLRSNASNDDYDTSEEW